MKPSHDVYVSPFVERYAGREMLALFSSDRKFKTWRRLWVALAEAERALGLPITASQVREMKAHVDTLNYKDARAFEEKFKHDVVAQVHAFAKQCPRAKPIIHLGATSAYVVDNTDLILTREALHLLRKELVNVIAALARFAQDTAELPTVAFTHFQPAQFTTVGKRACLWLQDLLLDLDELENRLLGLRFLGVKGATGTQASFLELFGGDERKVLRLDARVARSFGFTRLFRISGQTYTRKVDAQVHSLLSGIAQSAHKFSNDMRLLQHRREIEEPFGAEQVGSSAMAYKRNPMRSERIASLARLVITLAQNAAFTAAAQWFERTLDDSAGKRIALPEAFLAVDAILRLYSDIVSGLVVHKDVIRRNVELEFPVVATEHVLMQAVKAGGDRQELHERIRRHALAAAESAGNGKGSDLLDRLERDACFSALRGRLKSMLEPSRFIGRSPSQVREFLAKEVRPKLAGYRRLLGWKGRVTV